MPRASQVGVASQGSLWTIERVPEVIDGGTVRGVTDEHRVSMTPDGRTWIRKRVVTTGSNPLTAEAACWIIAHELQLDVPGAAVYLCEHDGNETSWLSKLIVPVLHWSEADYAQVVNLKGLGGLIALDVLTLNSDRHAGNLLVQPDGRTGMLRLWGIDSGNALIGQVHDFIEHRDGIPDPAVLPVHSLVKTNTWAGIVDAAVRSAEKIQQLNSIWLGNLLSEACSLGREPRLTELSQTLLHRRDRIVDLTNQYLEGIAGLVR